MTEVRRNRFIKLAGADKTINRDLETKARVVAGLKAYITNMLDPSPEFVIGACHQLWHAEKSFRMSKHDRRVALALSKLNPPMRTSVAKVRSDPLAAAAPSTPATLGTTEP